MPASNHPDNQREIEFASGGITLRGWLRTPQKDGSSPLVILAHGMRGLKDWEIPAFADAFNPTVVENLRFYVLVSAEQPAPLNGRTDPAV